MKKLFLIESPGKCHTIQKILGGNYEVLSTKGHIMDLPPKKFGVDLKNNFEPTYEVLSGKEHITDQIINKAKKCDIVYLATDGDREGSVISKNLYDLLINKVKCPIKRVCYTEITKSAILKAIENATTIEETMPLVNSQIARRITDRFCGYKTSFLTKMATGGISSGRVQSVALRLIVERCKEIKEFIPEEYWEVRADLLSPSNEQFFAYLDEKVKIKNEDEAREIYDKVKTGTPVVTSVESKVVETKTRAPFETQTLISTAKSVLGWTNSKTMSVAQTLFETSRISYHRTDAVSLAAEANTTIRGLIVSHYGNDYLSKPANFYKNKSSAQAGHEGIRPTEMGLEKYGSGDESKLYSLIWKRAVASQMTPVKDKRTKAVLDISGYKFVANGSVRLFSGWRKCWDYGSDDDVILPELKKGDKCKWNK